MDHLQRSLLNYFSLQPLDRAAHLRTDKQWLDSQTKCDNSIFYLLHNEKVITQKGVPLTLSFKELTNARLIKNKRYFLGKHSTTPIFAVNIPEISQLDGQVVNTVSLRDLVDLIDMTTASILAYAQLFNHWHLTTNYCGRCGGQFQSAQGGHVLECTRQGCDHIEFPRINPAVIMRVTCGEKILLARQKTWPKNRYSVLAGFVESGETLEHAVAREVMEEAGVKIHTVHYHSSQPWPFPSSLMIGYTAQTNDTHLDIENDDLETALWVTADQLIKHMANRSIIVSPRISISHRLIEDWFMEKTGRSIKEWQHITPEHIIYEKN